MPQATIGALRINLSMDSATFERAVKRARSAMQRLGRAAQAVGRIMKAAFAAAAAAVAVAAGAMAVAIRKTLNAFDELAKTSRAVGTTVEALSRLRLAAELSAVSNASLSKGIRKFASNALLSVGKTSDFTRALTALGVQLTATEAATRGLADPQVLGQLADAFAALPDSAAKTGLAMRLFGERDGPAFINLLNLGSAGLKKIAAEADAFGLTISTKAAVAAENFNDTLTRVNSVFVGLTNQITAALTPTLQRLADDFLQWAKDGSKAKFVADGIVVVFKAIVIAAVSLTAAIQGTIVTLKGLAAVATSLVQLDFTKAFEAGKLAATDLTTIVKSTTETLKEVLLGVDEQVKGILNQNEVAEQPPIAKKFQAAAAAVRTFKSEVERSRITAKKTAGDFLGLAGDVSGSFNQIFGENKALAIGQAVINTAAAVTKTLATYGATPFGLAAAATAAAAGAAQIATIQRTTRSSSGGGTSNVGAAQPAAGGQNASSQQQLGPQQAVNLTLNGDSFGREQVLDLIEKINDAVADGATVRVV